MNYNRAVHNSEGYESVIAAGATGYYRASAISKMSLFGSICTLILIATEFSQRLPLVQAETVLSSAEAVICSTLSADSSCEQSDSLCIPENRTTCGFPRHDSDIDANYVPGVVDDCGSPTCGAYLQSSITLNGTVVAKPVYSNPQYFKINITWSVENSDEDLTGGFQVKLNEDGHTKRCVCILNASMRSFEMLDFEYDRPREVMTMQVEVSPYRSRVSQNSRFSNTFKRPRGCADIPIRGEYCERAYGKPRNLTFRPTICNGVKQLDINWAPPSLHAGDLEPPLYYLGIFPKRFFIEEHLIAVFRVSNATAVKVTNLNASLDYLVYLQPYKYCSGAGSFGMRLVTEKFGCGDWTYRSERGPVSLCESSAVVSSITVTPSIVPTISNTPTPTPSNTPIPTPTMLLPLLALLLIPVALVILIVILCILVLQHKYDKEPRVGNIYKPDSSKLLILYCSNSPQKELTYIQKHVVSILSEYFEVVTPNDICSGNISEWLEMMVGTSKVVLLVANGEFCLEWKRNDRSQLINCLEHLISSAASCNSIEKFGFVVMQDHMVIPDNNYLKLLPVFVMRKGKYEVEKIYRFVTHSKPLEFTNYFETAL